MRAERSVEIENDRLIHPISRILTDEMFRLYAIETFRQRWFLELFAVLVEDGDRKQPRIVLVLGVFMVFGMENLAASLHHTATDVELSVFKGRVQMDENNRVLACCLENFCTARLGRIEIIHHDILSAPESRRHLRHEIVYLAAERVPIEPDVTLVHITLCKRGFSARRHPADQNDFWHGSTLVEFGCKANKILP